MTAASADAESHLEPAAVTFAQGQEMPETPRSDRLGHFLLPSKSHSISTKVTAAALLPQGPLSARPPNPHRPGDLL